MPQLDPIEITVDGSTEPLTFEPLTLANNLATFADESGSAPTLNKVFTVSVQRPSKTSKVAKVRIKLVVPVAKVVGGVATSDKDHENSFDITFLSAANATEVERAAIIDLLQSFLYKPDILAAITGVRPYY